MLEEGVREGRDAKAKNNKRIEREKKKKINRKKREKK